MNGVQSNRIKPLGSYIATNASIKKASGKIDHKKTDQISFKGLEHDELSFEERVKELLEKRKEAATKNKAKFLALGALILSFGAILSNTSPLEERQSKVAIPNASRIEPVIENVVPLTPLDPSLTLEELHTREYLTIPEIQSLCPWITDARIQRVLVNVSDIKHNPEDLQRLESMEISPPASSGMDSIRKIVEDRIQFAASPLEGNTMYRYLPDKNLILIDESILQNMNSADEMHMASFIHHEVSGHATYKNEDFNSIDQELQATALNVLSTSYQAQRYGEEFLKSANLAAPRDAAFRYRQAFFESSPHKPLLTSIMANEYGQLEITNESISKSGSTLAHRIKEHYETQINPNK